MLKFYKYTSDSFTDRVERKLKEMVIAHKLIRVNEADSLPEEVMKDDLPALSDGHQVWSSQKEITTLLKELHQDMMLSQSMQSDTCHLDPDNPDECL